MMDYFELFINHPDAVCLVDVVGNITESNDEFKTTVVKSFTGVNFLADIIHAQHHQKYGTVIEQLQADRLAGVRRGQRLGTFKTLTMSAEFQSCKKYFSVGNILNTLQQVDPDKLLH